MSAEMGVERIIAAARACIGTPFRHQGRLLGFGLDCAGVVVQVARDLGLGVVDMTDYGRHPSAAQLEEALSRQPFLARRAHPGQRQAGDVLLMRFVSDPQHLAIFTGQTIIHAYETVGDCCEHVLSPPWASRIVAAYAFKGGG